MLVDSFGSGLFLPFTVVYFLQTTSLGLPTIGAALSLAELATMAGLPIYGRLLDRLVGHRSLRTFRRMELKQLVYENLARSGLLPASSTQSSAPASRGAGAASCQVRNAASVNAAPMSPTHSTRAAA